MLNSKTAVIAVTLLSVTMSTAFSAPVMIDDFEDGFMNLIVDDGYLHSPTESRIESGLSGVIGDWRSSSVAWDEGLEDITLRINYRNNGVFSLAEASDTRGHASLSYGLGGPMDADLTDTGTNGVLVLTFLTADLAGTLQVDLSTLQGDQGKSTWTGPMPSGVFDTLTKMIIPLTGPGWTDNAALGAADRTSIDQIDIMLSGVSNGDYVIADIYTDVPEPATMGLMAMGGLALLRKRRKQ